MVNRGHCRKKKIHDFFIMSDVYQNSIKRKKNKEEIEKEALELRAKAKATLLSNKVFGAAIGAIPGVDWLVQKFLIKKDAVKKRPARVFCRKVSRIPQSAIDGARRMR